MKDNLWAKLSSIEYVHPHLGKIIFNGDCWEATPRFNTDHLVKRFPTLKDAITWMGNLKLT